MMADVTLITCTGGRPEAFALCERWMARNLIRTFDGRLPDGGPVQWIVVDDFLEPTQTTMGQEVLRPEPFWSGQSTLCRNLQAAIPRVMGDKVFFIEDDDFYAPGYLMRMASRLDTFSIVGQHTARYYNLAYRRYRQVGGGGWASLCQTAVRKSLLDSLAQICALGIKAIDVELWHRNMAGGCLFDAKEVVGIKGMPGRPGIGVGHRPPSHWSVDQDRSVLDSWIGADAAAYAPYLTQAELAHV